LLLLGLLSLPVLWWLLRVMPPRPRRVEFPPTRLLFDIAPKEETPSRTPWWLTALRLLAAALVILAAAGPIWNPQTGVAGSRAPLVILLDDGWSAASSWDIRVKAADELIANADSDRRGVALVPLSEPARDITIMTGGTARVALRQLAPKPYSIERVETLPALARFLKATGDTEIAWLTDGVDTGRGPEFLEGLSKTIGDRTLSIYEGGTPPALALAAAENAAAKMTVKVLRSDGGVAAGTVRAIDQKGSPIGRRSARPRPPSTCRSSCETTSRGSKYRVNDPPARCSCSTNVGAAARSASSAARPTIPRSRCWHRPSTSPARWRRSPTYGWAIAARRNRRSRNSSTRSCR
jgi:hypothetical protein